jgi:hypothetical protein
MHDFYRQRHYNKSKCLSLMFREEWFICVKHTMVSACDACLHVK